MEIADNLIKTLEDTRKIAKELEDVDCIIKGQKNIGLNGNRRIKLICDEMSNLHNIIYKRDKQLLRHQRNLTSTKHRQHEIVKDSPTKVGKRILVRSLNEVHQRLKLTRAGKNTISPFLEESVPRAFRNRQNFEDYFCTLKKGPQKPLPFVSHLTGKLENPVILPSYEEYLQYIGAEYIVKNTKDSMFHRIQKAISQLDALQEEINSNSFKKFAHSKRQSYRGRSAKDTLRDMYNPGAFYRTPTRKPKPEGYIEADVELEDSLRTFYKTKALENQKLKDIIDKIREDRGFSLREKSRLIHRDKESFRNQLHSISKFNQFRVSVEGLERQKQSANYAQAIAYMKVLENFKTDKHKLDDQEMLFLAIWKTAVEKGWVVGTREFDIILDQFSEPFSDSMEQLIDVLRDSVQDL